jgi:hypothetical protein
MFKINESLVGESMKKRKPEQKFLSSLRIEYKYRCAGYFRIELEMYLFGTYKEKEIMGSKSCGANYVE